MSDIVDQANDMSEIMLAAQRTVRKHSKLMAAGACHYCDELLPKVGQLFCNSECSEDYESEDRLRKQSGRNE